MEFKKYTLGELCNTVTDYVANGSFKSLADNVKYKDEKGYARVIRLVDFNNKYSIKDSIWVDEHGYEYLKKSKLFGGEIIITNVGANLGTVFIAPRLNNPMTLGPNAVMLKSNKNDLYLYYWLISPEGRNKIKAIVTGSAMPKFNKTDLKNIELLVPSIDNQDKIVNILGTIDKKIELNNQINDNLLDLGDILYKRYFKSEEIKKCSVCKLKDVVNNYDYKRKPMSSREREEHQGKYPYYGATSIIDYVDDYIFDGTYLLMGEDGTVVTDEGKPVLQYIWGKNWVNNHAHVLEGKNISTEHLMFSLRNCYVRDIITGAVQPKINQENMNSIEIILTDEENNEKFESIVNSIMNQYKNNIEQNKRLERLRDTLLPKLMNGEIDLDKVEI